MTKLSVNINKIATLRNARGGNNPDIIKAAINAQHFGADGITVHPRPDERHIRYDDVRVIKKIITTEFNIEGNPAEDKFTELVLDVKPHQVTLVPDTLGQLTSDHGWDTIKNKEYLIEKIKIFKSAGIRVSIFVDPVIKMIEGAAAISSLGRALLARGAGKLCLLGGVSKVYPPYLDADVKRALVRHRPTPLMAPS